MINTPFSLVSTVFNEIDRLELSITDIENQSIKPAEIIITDAGSTDGTYQRLMKWKTESQIPITILQAKGCKIAEGRDISIKNSKYSLIVSTDFGCRFHGEWLQSLLKPFDDEKVKVTGGAFRVLDEETISLAAKADYILCKGYRFLLDDYSVATSRSIAYYKTVWEEIGGYAEWLTLAADDTLFWKMIQKKGFKYRLVDNPYVYWSRHNRFAGFAKESYRYGLGNGECRLGLWNHFSLMTETLLRYSIPVHLFLLFLLKIPVWISITAGLAELCGLRSYLRAFRYWLAVKSEKYHFRIFLVSLYLIEITRINQLWGFTKGYWFSKPEITNKAREIQEYLSQ